MAVSIWEGSKAQELIDAIEQANKVDKQQGIANAGKALMVGNDGIVVPRNNGITNDIRTALLACFQNVAWVNQNGQSYYTALYDALYAEASIVRIDATFTQGDMVVRPETPLNDLKANLVVMGFFNDGTSHAITDYTLSGILTQGTSTITVTAEEKTDTFTVVVSASIWDYSWDASSEELPNGIISVSSYNFDDVPGALTIAGGRLDMDYAGDCELAWEGTMKNTIGDDSSPQFAIKSMLGSTYYKGAKVVCGRNDGNIYFNSSGTLTSTGYSELQNHVFDLICENGVITLYIDGNEISSGVGIESEYNNLTGFYNSQYNVMRIKNFKFRRL